MIARAAQLATEHGAQLLELVVGGAFVHHQPEDEHRVAARSLSAPASRETVHGQGMSHEQFSK